MRLKSTLPIMAALLAAGCAPGTKYNWGNYSKSLYDYQQDGAAQTIYLKSLESIIASDGPNSKVPPGIFAELGYLKLASGDASSAVALFEREKSSWPESAQMMNKAISSARVGNEKKTADAGITPVSLPTS
jgi:hypothetical protein